MTAKDRTLYDKIIDEHTVDTFDDGTRLILIDRIMLHERTGPVALNNIRANNQSIMDRNSVFCTIDHIVETEPGRTQISRMPGGEVFIDAMRKCASDFDLRLFDTHDVRQGIVHVIAPEQGIALPGITLVCPDSHTCTLGGLGTLAWGIGSTDCEHALVTKTLKVGPRKQMRIQLNGKMPKWLTSKDVIIHLIAAQSASGAQGHVIEFAGSAVRDMEVEQRLTLCNMAVEFGAFTGLVAPDEKTFEYVSGRPYGPAQHLSNLAKEHWKGLASDKEAVFDSEYVFNVEEWAPIVTWGTSPEDAIAVDQPIPNPMNETKRRALAYMGLEPGDRLIDQDVDVAFIGSCTNSRISDLRDAAAILKGRTISKRVNAICVPGSSRVKQQAETEGLDRIFKSSGFAWHDAGCSMCFSAGGVEFGSGARVISSTNRNFEGRQGPGTRTHIASPETVALSALNGRISDLRDLG